MKMLTCDRYTGCHTRQLLLGAAAVPLLMGSVVRDARATEPCGDFDECKVLIEINSSDGDIGFHWLVDADDLNWIRIDDADGAKVYENKAYGPLAEQKLTETFGESSEPVCRETLVEEEDDVVVTIEDFAERWQAGAYEVTGAADNGEKLFGETPLSYHLPAAPTSVEYAGGMISWTAGTDLGECATEAELYDLVPAVLPVHPMNVTVVGWEVVFELEDGSGVKFATRVPAGTMSVTVPSEIVGPLPVNTPFKIEVGAFGGDPSEEDDDNATFTELECPNLADLCGEEDEEEEEE
jgi:hypothetical protein